MKIRFVLPRFARKRPVPLLFAILASHFAAVAVALNVGGDQRLGGNPTASTQGKQAFISRCSTCHGIDGRGGEHAPDIATSAVVQQLSDADLDAIVRNGVPSRGMPSFQALGLAEIKTMVAYLRVLQGRNGAVKVNGNTSRGRELFFGPAHCSDCHMIRGEGGFLGPDLSDYSRSHSPENIRQAIVNPNRDLSPKADTVTAFTRDGSKLAGVARNEDNFSLQLQTPDGSFHLLMKSDLAALSHDHHSLMPSDYASRLSARDLDDVVSFLASVCTGSRGGAITDWKAARGVN